MTPHQEEIKELFDQVTVPLPGSKDLRVIKLDGFSEAIEKMMNKAYYYGCQQTMESAESIVDRVFNR